MGCQTKQTPVVVLKQKADHDFEFKQWDKAAEFYGEIVQREPHDWETQYRYGVSLLHLHKYGKAESALRIAHALDPQNDEIVFALADALHNQGKDEKLFMMLRDRAHDNRSVTTWVVLADYSKKIGDYDSALEAVTNACIVEDGENADPYYQAAVLLGRLGRTEDAVRRLRQAYAIDPSNEKVSVLLVEYGEIPGPTLGLAPGR
jgi:tetratricopeptide (TPR) repeat protein